jgi:hypothetical protein
LLSGEKTFDVRLVDFKCKPCDILVLREWDPVTREYTGRVLEKTVTYVLKTKDLPFAKEDIDLYGYQVLALK